MNNQKKILSVLLALILALSAVTAMPVGAAKADSLAVTGDSERIISTDVNGNEFVWEYDRSASPEIISVITEVHNVSNEIIMPEYLVGDDMYGYGRDGGDRFYFADDAFATVDPDIPITSIDFMAMYDNFGFDRFMDNIDRFMEACPELQTVIGHDNTYVKQDGVFCPVATPDEATPDEATPDETEPYIELSGGRLHYTSWSGGDDTDEEYYFTWAEGLKGNVVLPDNINGQPLPEWSELSFSDLPDVTSVTVPENFRIIFEDCENLTSVTYLGEDPYVYGGSFIDCPSISEINLPDCDSLHFEDGLLYNDDGVLYAALNKSGAYTVPDTITAIAINAFKSCKEITGITVPDSVTKLDADSGSGYDGGAFIHLPNLKRVTLPEGLTYIPGHIFESCTALERVNIPSTVEWIGWGAFAGCRSLEKITIPSSVQSIAYWCFFDTGLKEITFLSKTEMPTIYPTAIDENVVIKGYAGSPAEEYADQNHMQFIPLSEKSGDADGDGEITSVDVTLVQRYVASIDTDIPEELLMNADVDGDGRLEIVDATWIQRYLAHIDIPYAIG